MPSRLQARFLPQAFESIRKDIPAAKQKVYKARIQYLSRECMVWFRKRAGPHSFGDNQYEQASACFFSCFFCFSLWKHSKLGDGFYRCTDKVMQPTNLPRVHICGRRIADTLQQCKDISNKRLIRRFSWASTTRSTSSALPLSRRTVSLFLRLNDMCRLKKLWKLHESVYLIC